LLITPVGVIPSTPALAPSSIPLMEPPIESVISNIQNSNLTSPNNNLEYFIVRQPNETPDDFAKRMTLARQIAATGKTNQASALLADSFMNKIKYGVTYSPEFEKVLTSIMQTIPNIQIIS
jgi:hypothetical protein